MLTRTRYTGSEILLYVKMQMIFGNLSIFGCSAQLLDRLTVGLSVILG